jgi:hypothetical protein
MLAPLVRPGFGLTFALSIASSVSAIVNKTNFDTTSALNTTTSALNTTTSALNTTGVAPTRDANFTACDSDIVANSTEAQTDKFGVALHWQQPDDPNFYLAPGLGACGFNYTDQTNVVCVAPGWTKSANVNRCNTWVEVYSPDSGVVSQGIVWDACGAVPNSTFGCNDMYLSKQLFMQMAGKQRDQALNAGRLPNAIQWRFIDMPCWGCYAGLPGVTLNGTVDSCQGYDSMGFLRCGNMTGSDRIVGAAADFVCNQNVGSCQQASKIAAKVPHRYGLGNSTFISKKKRSLTRIESI